MCKDYRSDRDASWTKCTAQKKIGPYTYIVKVCGTELTWKRHANQIQECGLTGEVSNSNIVPSVLGNRDENVSDSLVSSLAGNILSNVNNEVPKRVSLNLRDSENHAMVYEDTRPHRVRRPPQRLTYV